jgi:hypothetical protein
MNRRTKIAAIVALVLLIEGGVAFAQSNGQRPPFNLDDQYPGPYAKLDPQFSVTML